MAVRIRRLRGPCIAVLVLCLLAGLSLGLTPAYAQTLFVGEQARNLFVSNLTANTIREFSPTGTDLGDFATTGLESPRGIAFDRSGNLYVANTHSIRKFSPTGADLGNFATTGLNVARGIAFDRRGNLYASNAGDNTVRKFCPSGADLGIFAST